jgi:SAM-dependent methyltransferase
VTEDLLGAADNPDRAQPVIDEFSEQRRTSFGSVAEQYDEARPGYPEQLVDAVLSYAGLPSGARALEIGAGTGQATAQFAWRGLSVHAVEPSTAMADLIATKFDGSGLEVTVEAADFESAVIEPGAFDLLIAPTSWHWLTPEVRWQRSAEALKSGGTLAVFWNWPLWRKSGLREELDAVYQRSGANLAELGPMLDVQVTHADLAREWMNDAPDPGAFTNMRTAEYSWSITYGADDYVALLGTYGDHLVLDASVRERLLTEVANVIDAHGGTIELPYTSHLLVARAR